MSRMNGQRAELLRDEIRALRADLGETVQALAARADVPARMRASAGRTAHRMRGWGDSPLPWTLLAAGATVALIVLLGRGRR